MIGDQIKAARKKRGYTQVELGDLIGVKGATVTRYEKGAIIPNYSTLEKIASALKIDIGELLTEEQLQSRKLNAANNGLIALLKTVYDTVDLEWEKNLDCEGVPDPSGEFTVTLTKGQKEIYLAKRNWETLLAFVCNNLSTFVQMSQQEPPEDF